MSADSENQFIYLFIPYFGKFPNYFQLYLDSASINCDILRIILITDIDMTEYILPANVKVFNIDFKSVRNRAIQVLKNQFTETNT